MSNHLRLDIGTLEDYYSLEDYLTMILGLYHAFERDVESLHPIQLHYCGITSSLEGFYVHVAHFACKLN
jgi:hypothetical protein